MRLFAILLLLSACNSSGGAGGDSETGNAAAAASNAGMPETAAQRTARLQARADAALSGVLREPRYSNLREGSLGAICGEVDSLQSDGNHGGPRPLVVTPDGVPLVSATPRIMFEDASDIFPDFYMRWCASPEEMRHIAALIERGSEAALTTPPVPDPVDELAMDPAVLAPDPPAPGEPAASPSERKAPPAPAASGPGPARDEDSFLNSVVRNPAPSPPPG